MVVPSLDLAAENTRPAAMVGEPTAFSAPRCTVTDNLVTVNSQPEFRYSPLPLTMSRTPVTVAHGPLGGVEKGRGEDRGIAVPAGHCRQARRVGRPPRSVRSGNVLGFLAYPARVVECSSIPLGAGLSMAEASPAESAGAAAE